MYQSASCNTTDENNIGIKVVLSLQVTGASQKGPLFHKILFPLRRKLTVVHWIKLKSLYQYILLESSALL